MKTQIVISGGVAGNHEILSKLHSYRIKTPGQFPGTITLDYHTKKEAQKDLQAAFKSLCEDEPDMVDRLGGVAMNGDTLEYDASTATIEPSIV